MRRRTEDDVIPHDLTVFDGKFATAAEWNAAFDIWWDARELWEAAHPGVVLPKRIVNGCPFDSDAI
jgi:hypothetical protein